MADKLLELKKTLSLLDPDRITSEVFLQAIKEVAAHFDARDETRTTDLLTLFRDALQAFKDSFNQEIADYKAKNDSIDTERSTAAETRLADALNRIDDAIARADTRVAELKSGDPGKDADEAAIQQRITDYFSANLPMFAEAFRNGLETLQEDERLDTKAIRGLEIVMERIDKLEKRPQQTYQTPPDFRAHFKDIDLSDQLDGATKTFDIPATYNILAVHLSSFPHALRKAVDFTYTPITITFTDEIDAATSLAAGQTCVLTVVTG